jgi:hypothetical protein
MVTKIFTEYEVWASYTANYILEKFVQNYLWLSAINAHLKMYTK